jgi:CheY-like chemotaxis protein
VQSPKSRADTLSILLVEDDIDAADITKILLESLGVEVTLAHSGSACRELVSSGKNWDKILLDVHLPDENGLNLAKFILGKGCTKQTIIISGAEIDQISIQQRGCDYALLKPLNRDMLRQVIEK